MQLFDLGFKCFQMEGVTDRSRLAESKFWAGNERRLRSSDRRVPLYVRLSFPHDLRGGVVVGCCHGLALLPKFASGVAVINCFCDRTPLALRRLAGGRGVRVTRDGQEGDDAAGATASSSHPIPPSFLAPPERIWSGCSRYSVVYFRIRTENKIETLLIE